MAQHRDHFKPGAMVTDVCGVKGAILEGAKVLPDTVSFVGGHPMAGTEFSGIQHALVNMFHGAHYILTPNDQSRPEHVALMERLAVHIGCANIVKTTPENHDAIIAYTSQMMHIIAVAVCDDPSLFQYQGFEGDSFRGCTRVAALDVPLWTQLFTMNSKALGSAGGAGEKYPRLPPGHRSRGHRHPGGKADLLRRPQAENEPPGAANRRRGAGGEEAEGVTFNKPCSSYSRFLCSNKNKSAQLF